MPSRTTEIASPADLMAKAPGQFSPGMLVLCPFPDHDVLCDPADDKIAATLMAGRPYQRRHIQASLVILARNGRLPPDGLFLDIGANIGTMTLYAMRSGSFSGAIAIEPEPHNHQILRRNIALNGLSGEVETIAAAAGAEVGRADLIIAARNRGAHSLSPLLSAAAEGRTIEVPVTTVDKVVARSAGKAAVTLVKIDVEGHELAVLDGMTALIGAGVPLLIELTCAPVAQAAARVAALRARLGSCYRTVVDLERATPECLPEPVALAEFAASAAQHDLLIF